MDTKSQMKEIVAKVNAPKKELLRIARELEAIHPKSADQLCKIIARLEGWQTK